MNSKTKKQFRIQWQQNAWTITERGSSNAPGIRIDSAVVNATRRGDGFVEGYILAVHGLNQADAQHLDRAQLADLGVGSHLRGRTNPGARGLVNLTADGQIHGGPNDRG